MNRLFNGLTKQAPAKQLTSTIFIDEIRRQRQWSTEQLLSG